MGKSISYLLNPELPVIREGWRGNILMNGRFSNSNERERMPLREVLRWKFSKNPQKEEKRKDPFRVPVIKNSGFLPDKRDMIVWLGHASFFIRAGGKNILADPVFTDLPFIPRKTDLPCEPGEFRNIDLLLLSHAHRDHLDRKTLKLIFDNNPGIKVLGPLGVEKLVKGIYKKVDVQEAAWYQKFDLNAGSIDIDFLPAFHWNRRGLFDFNTVLWGSMMIRTGGRKIYFCGDSAYGDHFAEIGRQYGSVDVALMPIGAYKPHYLMNRYHMNPKQSVKAFCELKGSIFVPMHYGTFDLSDEPPGEPPGKIKRLFGKIDREKDLRILNIGEELVL